MTPTNPTPTQQGQTLREIALTAVFVIGLLAAAILVMPILFALTIKVAEVVFKWVGI